MNVVDVSHVGNVESRSSPSSCIFCGIAKKDESLSVASENGVARLQAVVKERLELGDTNLILCKVSKSDISTGDKYHRTCYGNFTSEGKLKRLRNRKQLDEVERENLVVSQDAPLTESRRNQRTGVDWSKCLFCQDDRVRPKSRKRSREPEKLVPLCKIMSMNMSDRILRLKQYNEMVQIRCGDVADLIAVEAKYHLDCYMNFKNSFRANEEGT